MATQFLQAPILEDGVVPNHRHMNALASSVNSRLRSGIGNSVWRIAYAAAAFTRQIRNPAEGPFQSVWPPQDEWINLYAHSRQPWTVTPPGEYEGLNVNSPLPMFVYGNESVPVYGESERLSQSSLLKFDTNGLVIAPAVDGNTNQPIVDRDYSGVRLDDVSTPGQVWTLGKLQRGLALNSTHMRAPSLLAAESHFAIAPNHFSKMGVTFGGWMPMPRVIGSCSLNFGDQQYRQDNYQFRFAAIAEGGSDLVVTGFCPSADPGRALAALYEYPIGYFLVFQDGHTALLPYEQYLLVLNGSGRATNQPNAWFGQGRMFYWDIVFGRWCQAFRGSDAQVEETGWRVQKTAFQFELIAKRNHLLAPMRAELLGDGTLREAIPRYEWTSGDFSFAHTVASGFVVTALFVGAYELSVPLRLRVKVGARTVDEIVLPSGEVVREAIRVFQEDLIGTISVEAVGGVFADRVQIELLEQLSRLPELRDLALLTRLGCAGPATSDTAEQLGDQVENPIDRSRLYLASGTLLNAASEGLSEPSDIVNNGIYEAARRQINEHIKCFPRSSLRSYETIQEEGVVKSVLEIDRYPLNPNDRLSQAFEHMGPSDQPVQKLVQGYSYVVDAPSGGQVTYAGQTYHDLDTFIGEEGEPTFEAENAFVYEWEGIREEAPPEGFSNEWVVFFSWMPYGVGDPWHPEQYGDLLGHLNNPGLLWNEEMRGGNPFTNQALADVSRTIRPTLQNGHTLLDQSDRVFYAECPDGWNFPRGSNAPSDSRGLLTYGLTDEEYKDYFKSLQIYQDPYEVQSITPVRRNGKWDWMRVVLKSRLRHDERSSGRSFRSNVDSWYELGTLDWLRGETYATDENRLVKYMLWRDRGEQWPVVLGDTAVSAWQSRAWPAAMRGCILPRLHAVKLIPKVWEDSNDRSDPKDTRLWVTPFLQMAQYAPMAEGFMDAASTVGMECDITTDADPSSPIKLVDYSIPEWCRQAFGKRFFEFMPSSERRDSASAPGAGPLPGVRWSAEQYNQYAKAFNTLTRARLEIPLLLEEREVHTSGLVRVQALPGSTTLADGERTTSAGGWVIWSGVPPTTGDFTLEREWSTVTADRETVFQSLKAFNIGNFLIAWQGALHYVAQGSEIRTEWRIKPDQFAYLALPSGLRELANTQATLLVKQKDIVVGNTYTQPGGDVSKARTTEFENGVQIGQTLYQDITGGWDSIILERTAHTTRTCFFSGGGHVIAPTPNGSLVYDNGSNYGLVTGRRFVWPVGTQIGDGNLFVSVPVASIVV